MNYEGEVTEGRRSDGEILNHASHRLFFHFSFFILPFSFLRFHHACQENKKHPGSFSRGGDGK
jgi:hypothetical protein